MVVKGASKKEGRSSFPLIINEDKLIKILLVALAILFISIGVIYTFYLKEEEIPRYETYEFYSGKFSSDLIIMDITIKCSAVDNPVRCVFDEIPYDYDFSRLKQANPQFRTPDEYFLFGGVCRDYTLLRHSVLTNLGIECIFNFNTPEHVYLNCYDDDKVYELNNDRYREWMR